MISKTIQVSIKNPNPQHHDRDFWIYLSKFGEISEISFQTFFESDLRQGSLEIFVSYYSIESAIKAVLASDSPFDTIRLYKNFMIEDLSITEPMEDLESDSEYQNTNWTESRAISRHEAFLLERAERLMLEIGNSAPDFINESSHISNFDRKIISKNSSSIRKVEENHRTGNLRFRRAKNLYKRIV